LKRRHARDATTPETPPATPQAVAGAAPAPRPVAATPRRVGWRLAGDAVLLQLHGCAGLCAFAAAVGVARVAAELSFHTGSNARLLGLASALLAVGVVLGFGLPRALIRTRLGRSGSRPGSSGWRDGHSITDETCDFAASHTGGLVVVLGVVWLLVCGAGAGMEAYRAWLTRSFIWPVGAMSAALCAPLGIGLLLLGCVGTTTILALKGWRRSLLPRCPVTIGVGPTLLLAVTGGGAVAAVAQRGALLDFALLVAMFGAGVLAVARRPSGRVSVDDGAGRVRGLRQAGGSVAMAALAASAGGTSVAMQLPAGPLSPSQTGVAVMVVGGSAVVGLVLSAVVVRILRSRPGLAPFAWLPVAIGGLISAGVGASLGLMLLRPATAGQDAGAFGRDRGRGARELAAGLAGLTTERVAACVPREDAGGAMDAWDIDLAGRSWDVLVVGGGVGDAGGMRASELERLLARCRRGLLDGGRLVLEPAVPEGVLRGWELEVLRVRLRVGGVGREVLVVGTDVRAWLGYLSADPASVVHVSDVERIGDGPVTPVAGQAGR
jgi:hypothetical protein